MGEGLPDGGIELQRKGVGDTDVIRGGTIESCGGFSVDFKDCGFQTKNVEVRVN